MLRGQPCLATGTGRRLCRHADRVRLMEHELQAEVPRLLTEHQPPVSVPIAVNADSVATWFADALAGMGRALHPLSLIREHLASGRLVELVPGTDLDVPVVLARRPGNVAAAATPDG